MTKTEKIRRALLKTPKAKAKVVAERLGVTVQDVYDTRYQMKKESKAYPHSYARAATPLETPVNMRKEMLKEVMPGLKALFGTDYAGTPPEVKKEVVKTDMVNHPPHYFFQHFLTHVYTRYQMKKESKAYPHSYARAATPLETPVNMRKEMLKEVMPGLKALFGTDYAGTPPEVKKEVVKTDMVNHPPHYTVGGRLSTSSKRRT